MFRSSSHTIPPSHHPTIPSNAAASPPRRPQRQVIAATLWPPMPHSDRHIPRRPRRPIGGSPRSPYGRPDNLRYGEPRPQKSYPAHAIEPGRTGLRPASLGTPSTPGKQISAVHTVLLRPSRLVPLGTRKTIFIDYPHGIYDKLTHLPIRGTRHDYAFIRCSAL